jgi:hypothetical protein
MKPALLQFPRRLAIGLICATLSFTVTAKKQTLADEIRPDAPDQYTVVKGDTLWSISGKFLKKPWLWPQIWQMNKSQIKNPHWIYPGELLILDRTTGTLRKGKAVTTGQNDASMSMDDVPMVKLTPEIRTLSMSQDNAIPSIPASLIEPFLTKPLIVEENELVSQPRIIATQENRVVLGAGDNAYARGFGSNPQTDWMIYRPSRPLKDPETQKPIAWEATYLGTASIIKQGDIATLNITSMKEEIGIGDRLMPAEQSVSVNYVPRAPEKPIRARIVSVVGGVSQAGQNSIIAINAGAEQGIEVGHVLALNHKGATIIDRTSTVKKETVTLPDEKIGVMFIFRTFKNISYGLIMSITEPVEVGDVVTEP